MKTIDDIIRDLAEVKRQRDEYYDELLSKRQRIAELEAKLAQTSEKACEWFQYNAWSFGNYAKGDGSYEWEMAFECFRKAMEEYSERCISYGSGVFQLYTWWGFYI